MREKRREKRSENRSQVRLPGKATPSRLAAAATARSAVHSLKPSMSADARRCRSIQEVTHLRFRGDGYHGQHFQVSSRFGAFVQVPAGQFTQDKRMQQNEIV